MQSSQQDLYVRAIHRLTIAVWTLTAVTAALVVIHLIPYLFSFSEFSGEKYRTKGDEPRSVTESLYAYPDFHAMPLERQIELASVIVIAKYEPDGKRVKCVLSEVLKQTPSTKFYFKSGDEVAQCSYYPKPDETRGDGQVMFFVGSPADFRFSTAFYGDRVGGLGNMPLGLLRKQISDKQPTK